MTSLRELKSELAEVDQLLHATWLKEREDARRRIAELAVEYQLSATTITMDVEAAHRRAAPTSTVLRPPKFDLPLRGEAIAQHLEARYRNAATGDSWSGRGPRPRWLRAAVDAGALLEDFLVGRDGSPEVSDPLRDFQNAARRTQLADGA
nr:H-NS histone family protein [Variovorax boronicumulans]